MRLFLRKRRLCFSVFILFAVGSSCAPAWAQSSDNPAFILYKQGLDKNNIDTDDESQKIKRHYCDHADFMLSYVKEDGFEGRVADTPEYFCAILLGPYNSLRAFDQALAKLKEHNSAYRDSPVFLTRLGAPSEAPSDPAQNPVRPPSASPSQTRVDVTSSVRWLENTISQSGGVSRGLSIEPTGATSDVIGPNHSFEVYTQGLVLGRDSERRPT